MILKKAEKILKDSKTKERIMLNTHTLLPIDNYRFFKLRLDYKENGKDKFLFIVIEKNKFKKALLDNCREYRFYEIKKDKWVEEHKLKKRFLRKCSNGCEDSEIIVIEKANGELKNKKDPKSWIYRDVWKCSECGKSWLVTCDPDNGDSFEEAVFFKSEKGKRFYKTKKGITAFGKSPVKKL